MSWRDSIKRFSSEFRKHPWLHALSILTLMISLVVVGGFLMVYKNVDHFTATSKPELTLSAYLNRELSESEKKNLSDDVLALDHVTQAIFKSPDETKKEISELLSSEELSDRFASELFPSVFEVSFKEGSPNASLDKVFNHLEGLPFVTDLDASNDFVTQFQNLKGNLKLVGIIMMAVVLIGCGFLIANFMGMRHQSRKKDMDIIALMGASSRFIFTPILLEAIIEGLTAAVLALGVLFFLKNAGLRIMGEEWLSVFRAEHWLYLTPLQSGLIVIFGLSMAILGSFSVLSRFRRS